MTHRGQAVQSSLVPRRGFPAKKRYSGRRLCGARIPGQVTDRAHGNAVVVHWASVNQATDRHHAFIVAVGLQRYKRLNCLKINEIVGLR